MQELGGSAFAHWAQFEEAVWESPTGTVLSLGVVEDAGQTQLLRWPTVAVAARWSVPVVATIPKPVEGCRQAEKEVILGAFWPVGLLTQQTHTKAKQSADMALPRSWRVR